MRYLGLGVYWGHRDKREKYPKHIKLARNYGFSEIFLGIGYLISENVDLRKELEGLKNFIKLARDLGYYVFSDINPDFLKLLNATTINLEPFKDLGLSGLRLDDEFNVYEIATIIDTARKSDLWIELNASYFPFKDLDKLMSLIKDNYMVKASHDFYPPSGSGIPLKDVIYRSSLFKKYGISVGIFVGSSDRHYINTVESLRKYMPEHSAEILYATGVIDRVLIGDPLAPERDLKALSEVASRDYIKIRAIPYQGLTEDEKKAFNHVMLARQREVAVSAGYFVNNNVKPRCVVRRYRGALSIMTNRPNYLEIWIWKADQRLDSTYTIIGEILEEDMEIVELIKDRDKILIEPINL